MSGLFAIQEQKTQRICMRIEALITYFSCQLYMILRDIINVYVVNAFHVYSE